MPLYEAVAHQIAAWIDRIRCGGRDRCGDGRDLPARTGGRARILPHAPLLIPGVGEQGAAVEEVARASIDAEGYGAIVSSSRSVTYASSGDDYATAARNAAMDLRAVD